MFSFVMKKYSHLKRGVLFPCLPLKLAHTSSLTFQWYDGNLKIRCPIYCAVLSIINSFCTLKQIIRLLSALIHVYKNCVSTSGVAVCSLFCGALRSLSIQLSYLLLLPLDIFRCLLDLPYIFYSTFF